MSEEKENYFDPNKLVFHPPTFDIPYNPELIKWIQGELRRLLFEEFFFEENGWNATNRYGGTYNEYMSYVNIAKEMHHPIVSFEEWNNDEMVVGLRV